MRHIPDSLSQTADFLARHSAILVLAVFAVAGAAVFTDYGVALDDTIQRKIGYASYAYILGDEGALIEGHSDRFYGVAFEVPLIVVERLLGLEYPRDIYLSRRAVTHLFFLAGGFFAWLLAHRLFGSRRIALVAMLLFLLHPRMYAHSFFNTKDLPFLSMFMVSLYLAHRAFRRDTVWGFALCGAGVALLANIRIIGAMLIPAVLVMLALDAVRGAKLEGRRGARHELANAAAFAAAFAAVFYAAWPLLWRDPLNLSDALETMSRHPTLSSTLFRYEYVQWPNVPWDYAPTWILLTTPPAALLLAALGIGRVARLCAARRRAAFENSPARFGLLALACLILPAVFAVALNSNLYNGWRQMYFLYAPLCVLAAFGLRTLADIPKPSLRDAALALAALALALAAVRMVQLHPYQNEYFSPLVDKTGLGDRWQMDYWDISYKEALETLLTIQPSGIIAATGEDELYKTMRIISEDDKRRLYLNPNFPSFRIVHRIREYPPEGDAAKDAAIWTREIYGVPIVSILDVRAESEAAHREIYAAARASQADASGGGFDMYADGGELTYAKEGCGEEDARARFGLSVFPVDQDDLPQTARHAGLEYEPIYFDFHAYGAVFDGKCVIVRRLPGYPISHIETWRQMPGGNRLWSAIIPIDESSERYRRALASLSGEPAARSGFDVYLQDGTLTYVKSPCAESDARGRFFLSVFPADPRDLSQAARDAGLEHEPLNFGFERHGGIFDGKCVIVRYLPDYPISRVETGQWLPGEGELWSARVEVGE